MENIHGKIEKCMKHLPCMYWITPSDGNALGKPKPRDILFHMKNFLSLVKMYHCFFLTMRVALHCACVYQDSAPARLVNSGAGMTVFMYFALSHMSSTCYLLTKALGTPSLTCTWPGIYTSCHARIQTTLLSAKDTVTLSKPETASKGQGWSLQAVFCFVWGRI